MLVWGEGKHPKLAYKKTPVLFIWFSNRLLWISLITFSTVQRSRLWHCVSPINPTLQAYIVQNLYVALSLDIHTEIMVTFHEFLFLDCHAITRHCFHPFLIYLCRDSGVTSLLILWRAQVPLLWQSVRLETCSISCHLPQQFKIIPDFKLENILLIFPVNHCWRLHVYASASSAEKRKSDLKFPNDKESITICILLLVSQQS